MMEKILMKAFAKQPRTVSIKQYALNFDSILREVNFGRVINIRFRKEMKAVLVPISAKERVAFKRRTKHKTLSV